MLSLNDEQRMLVESLREISEREFEDKACEWNGEKPWENIELLADRGYLGINMPEEYGGGGMSEFEAVLMSEVIGRVCPDTAYALAAHQMVAPRAIEMFATEAAKEQYLPSVIAGDDAITIAMSEPEAGSDMKSMNTNVDEQDGELILNGEKTWVSGVPDASAAVVWTKFPEGLGSLIIEFDWDGVEIGQHFTNMMGHTQTQFFMEDIVIPEENVLTRGPEGFKQQLKALNWERIASATLANATALCAFDKAVNYALDRKQFGQPIGDFQGIEWKLADMAKKIQASRGLIYTAVRRSQEPGSELGRLDTSIAKLYSSEILEHVASESLQIHGANGYQQGHPMEYLYRFARSRRIAAGTDEIQKNTIAGAVKRDGLPHLG